MHALRAPEQVMRLARLGAFHQTRLSFMRVLLRQLGSQAWQFDRPIWTMNADGVGMAVYRMRGPEHTYSLVCFSHDLDATRRTDRVIAEAWDATFALYDGEPNSDELKRLAANVPLQEAGRFKQTELVLSRVNKSIRLFDHVIDALASGRQPDSSALGTVGYLMRTTAVYGNGKFGLADRAKITARPELAGPFHAEMLTIWLIRAFTLDLVEHIAIVRSSRAVPLNRTIRRRLGVGNATGLGLGPFLINHPVLLARWLEARETALARVRALPIINSEQSTELYDLVGRAHAAIDEWRIDDRDQSRRVGLLRADLERLSFELRSTRSFTWDQLYRWGEATLSLEGCELLVSLLLELHGDLVDDLARHMSPDEHQAFRIDGSGRIGELRESIATHYRWAVSTDFGPPSSRARFWYVSEDKLEPRLGDRYKEPGVKLELPLGVAYNVSALDQALAKRNPNEMLGDFLASHPEHRHTVRRVQTAAKHPYSEIQDNLLDAEMAPIDLLRCKLSFFGATRFDPKSDRWLRINMYQNAPFPDELTPENADNWAFPQLPNSL